MSFQKIHEIHHGNLLTFHIRIFKFSHALKTSRHPMCYIIKVLERPPGRPAARKNSHDRA